MKIACVIILYYPDEYVLTNIQSYVFSFEKTFIVDNTEKREYGMVKKINNIPGICYLHDHENKGIASRLNQVCEMALSEGFEWILTMDQDSYFEQYTIEKYIGCVKSLPQKKEIAMFGVNYENNLEETDTCICEEVDMLITSGSIINLGLFSHIGGFDSNLFIDYVDVDYCLKALANGYKVLQFRNIYLTHFIGTTYLHRSIKNLTQSQRTLHTPSRLYYMARNFLYISHKYRVPFKGAINKCKKGLLISIKNNLLYNRKRLAVLTYIVKGFNDYRTKQMGKLAE